MTAIITTAPRFGVHPILTKRITPDGVIQFGDVLRFDMSGIEFDDFATMIEIVEWLETEPSRALIRGEPIADGPNQRRLLRDQPDGSKATIRPVEGGLQWVMLDLDKLPAPADLADTDEARLAYLRSTLPPAFRSTTCYYQWSSSAGLKGWSTLSAHLWFWLDRPHTCANLHKRAAHKLGDWRGMIDPAHFTPNQVHYTAAPVFDGVSDPLERRSGIIRGDADVVTLENWIEPYVPRPVYTSKVREAVAPGRGFDDLIAEIGSPHFHLPILQAIAHYVAVTVPRFRNRDKCLNRVREAAAFGAREYIDDQYLERVYEDAVQKFGRTNQLSQSSRR